MTDKIITFCYRKIIDAQSTKPWDKLVFEDTYQEFKMQAQLYNQEKKYTNFAQLVQHVPGADKLHYLVSGSITGYLQQLNQTVPDILDNLGKHFLSFSNYQFEIINSDIQDKMKHQVAINFYSDSLIWHETIGTYLLVSGANSGGSEILTHLVQLQPYLSVYSLKTAA